MNGLNKPGYDFGTPGFYRKMSLIVAGLPVMTQKLSNVYNGGQFKERLHQHSYNLKLALCHH